MLQVTVITDRNGNVLTTSVLERWKEYFKQLMIRKNERKD